MKTNNDYEITAEDIKLGARMWEARQKGLYFETRAVTNLYNKLFHTNLTATSCGSCLRKRIDGIHNKLEELKELTEPKPIAEPKQEQEIIIEPKQEANVKENITKGSGKTVKKDKVRVTKKSSKV